MRRLHSLAQLGRTGVAKAFMSSFKKFFKVDSAGEAGTSHHDKYPREHLTFDTIDRFLPNWARRDHGAAAFEWRGGSDPCTKGVSVFPTPFVKKVDEERVCTFLLDAQGAFDPSMTPKLSQTIYGFMLAVSSLVIVNVTKLIDADVVKKFVDLRHDGTRCYDEKGTRYKKPR